MTSLETGGMRVWEIFRFHSFSTGQIPVTRPATMDQEAAMMNQNLASTMMMTAKSKMPSKRLRRKNLCDSHIIADATTQQRQFKMNQTDEGETGTGIETDSHESVN